MPQPPSPEDWQLIDNFRASMVEAAAEVPQAVDLESYCVRQAIQPEQIRQTEARLAQAKDRQYPAEILVMRWVSLELASRQQTTKLCIGMTAFMEERGIAAADQATLLRDTVHVGRQFGALPPKHLKQNLQAAHELPPEALDEQVVTRSIIESPSEWVTLDGDGRLDFTTEVKRRMEQSYHRRLGCSALYMSIKVAGGTEISLFDGFWNIAVDDFIKGDRA